MSVSSSLHARPHILVAEDDVEMRQLVVDCLKRDGYALEAVSDGRALLASVEHSLIFRAPPKPVDLVLTDNRMPNYSGLDVVRALRNVGFGAPIVVMTAFGDAETRQSVAALGAYFLDKPFRLEVLRALVQQLLSGADALSLAGG